MKTQQYEMGMVGLGVMGGNLLLNIADHGYSIVGYNRNPERIKSLRQEGKGLDIRGAENVEELVGLLRVPRVVMLLVPAGEPVDEVIAELVPHLQPGDLIIDGGNSHFKDTDRRAAQLAEKGIQFLGMGISGGEKGARNGPCMMPGGPREAYKRIGPVLEAVAARVDNEPCVAYMGPGSAGHYVKMIHNGIEYAIMELISETYDLMKRGLGLDNDRLHEVYTQWNESEVKGYLMEITGAIFKKIDEKTGKPLIDAILDVARQKGTGMWTTESAMALQTPVSVIDVSVEMRDLSVFIRERKQARLMYSWTMPGFTGDRSAFLTQLRQALYVGMIVSYAQGMALLTSASEKYEYNLHLDTIAHIWRGGCIIRSELLNDIYDAYRKYPDLSNLLFAPRISYQVTEHHNDLRQVVRMAASLGIPTPGFMATLSYLDAYRSPWLPTNLIQAQRDYFGSHTYERVDAPGTFHTEWEEP
ncbi:MAG: NADP-dependent phosphogluconate dehydrogenase [Candidatus Omnitrophota bacterium]